MLDETLVRRGSVAAFVEVCSGNQPAFWHLFQAQWSCLSLPLVRRRLELSCSASIDQEHRVTAVAVATCTKVNSVASSVLLASMLTSRRPS